jgi:hypothetical protein
MERNCPKCKSPMKQLTHRVFPDPAMTIIGSTELEIGGTTGGALVSWRCDKCGHQTKREVEILHAPLPNRGPIG